MNIGREVNIRSRSPSSNRAHCYSSSLSPLANKADLRVGSYQISAEESQIPGRDSRRGRAIWQGDQNQLVAMARRLRAVCVLTEPKACRDMPYRLALGRQRLFLRRLCGGVVRPVLADGLGDRDNTEMVNFYRTRKT
jgi:hypothetical protein